MKCFAIVVTSVVVVIGTLWLTTTGLSFLQHSITEPLRVAVPINLPADIRVADVRVMGQADAAPEWEVFAKEAKMYQAEQRTELRAVAARLAYPDESPVQMTAAHGHIDNASGNMTVAGEVRLQYDDGYAIETDTLYWQAADGTLHTEAPVTIQNTSVHIVGTGLRSKVDQQQIAIQHDVRASFQLQNNQ
jgi:LPS export ABC transporter protein LptC